MKMDIELKTWKEVISKSFEWYTTILEVIQEDREHGYNTFAYHTLTSVEALKLKLNELQNLSNPNIKECKKIKKSLEESIKHRIKALELEIKYFQDIQGGALAGKFGAGAVNMAATRAGETLKESLEEFHKVFRE